MLWRFQFLNVDSLYTFLLKIVFKSRKFSGLSATYCFRKNNINNHIMSYMFTFKNAYHISMLGYGGKNTILDEG